MKSVWYPLPDELIAQEPVNPRDSSRLLLLHKVTGQTAHHSFRELPNLLRPGDVLVRNNSRVIPARLFGTKPTGGKIEVLLNRLLDPQSNTWECLLKPGLKEKTVLTFPNNVSGEVIKPVRDNFTFQIKFNCLIEQLYKYLDFSGHVPLPPYVEHSKTRPESYWKTVYQTTYAKENGSVAAPTAGLHFTKELDERLTTLGIEIAEVSLHVGLGTFAPIKVDDFTKHTLHQEDFTLSADVATKLNQAKKAGRRIIAVGTTTVRVLEHCSDEHGQLTPQSGSTSIYIYPPYKFKFVDALITNFHLPGTSLLLLVSALCSTPNTPNQFTDFQSTTVGRAYAEAIAQKYRFFSFGDAMLVV